jgi:hypothetical protein
VKYQATPQIVVLEYDPVAINSYGNAGMFRVVNRDTVPRSEFTLDNTVKKIVEFNGIYKPKAIYVDRGYGEYQLEVLHRMGKDAEDPSDPAWGLDSIVKGFTYSDKIEIRDPATNKLAKKDIKPFIMNQTALLLERDRLIINNKDKLMWKQMQDYQVVKISTDGRPTFTSVNEHTVDALALSVLGLILEAPELARTIYAYDPTRVMAIAPPIPRSEPDFKSYVNPPKKKKDDEEKFWTSKGKENNSQTWFRVDDLQRAKSNRTSAGINYVPKNIVVPRGSRRNKSYSRPTF